MKLSEAMMLPSDVPFSSSWYLRNGCGCLIGQAYNAITGKMEASLKEMTLYWPWLNNYFVCPSLIRARLSGQPEIMAGQQLRGDEIVSRFAVFIDENRATREQAADWVRSVEPEEPALPIATIAEQVDKVTV